MSALPAGQRLDTVTYRVTDDTGFICASGLTTEAAADALIARLLDVPGARTFTIERTTYVSFTYREPIRTVGEE